jgi:hypothetical protein
METVTEQINEGSPKMENKMTSEEINKLAKELVEDVKRVHARLDEVQDACLHKDIEVGVVDGSLRTTCVYCYKAIGYPTKEQANKAGYDI